MGRSQVRTREEARAEDKIGLLSSSKRVGKSSYWCLSEYDAISTGNYCAAFDSYTHLMPGDRCKAKL